MVSALVELALWAIAAEHGLAPAIDGAAL